MLKKKFDNILSGAIIGLVAPFLFSVGFYLINYSYTTYKIMIEHYYDVGEIATLISLCLLTNLLAFFIFYWTKFEMAPRGVILGTFVWGMAIVYFKM